MDTSRDRIVDAVAGFVRSRQRVAENDSSFTPDTHLFETGYVDSIGMVELVAFVEETYGIQFDEEQLFSDAFTTINGIAGLVGDCLLRKA